MRKRTHRKLVAVAVAVATAAVGTIGNPWAQAETTTSTTTAGPVLLGLYTFDEGAGNIARDSAGGTPAADLVIADPGATRWVPGGLAVNGGTTVATAGRAARLNDHVRQGRGFSIEAWVRPAAASDDGVIVSVAGSASARNVTLSQGTASGGAGTGIVGRSRTSLTGAAGKAVSAPSGLYQGANHVVLTRWASGWTTVSINGKPRAALAVNGSTSSWDSAYRLFVGSEAGGGSPWSGELLHLAIYDGVLSDAVIARRHAAGPPPAPSTAVPAPSSSTSPTTSPTTTATTAPATTTTVAPAPAPAPTTTTTITSAPSTGLRRTFGVYRGANPTELRAYETWSGVELTHASAFFHRSSWDAMKKNAAWSIAQLRGLGYQTVYALPMLVNDGGTLRQGASGAYDQHFRDMARLLVDGGQSTAVLRLGWEFNGDWFPWSAARDPQSFVTYWRRIVTVMRAVPGSNFRFDWNPGAGRPVDEATYPGDAYVDIIGLDVYDRTYGTRLADPVARWQDYVDRPGGLRWQQGFARAHGKQISFPEWAVTQQHYGSISGDNPYFVTQMLSWIASNNVAYQSYFETDTAEGTFRLMTGAYPNASAAFRRVLASS